MVDYVCIWLYDMPYYIYGAPGWLLQEATELGKKARELKKAAEALHQEERSGSKGRKFRKNVKEVEKVNNKYW